MIATFCDYSAPIGAITPAAQVPGIGKAAICLQVNGTVRQTGRTDQNYWNIAGTIASSAAWALEPGDLIYTGPPKA